MAASGILAQMSVVLGAEISDFQRKMAAAKKELAGLSKVGEGLKNIGSTLTAGLSAPLSLAAAGAVKLAGDMEKANVNFEVLLGSAEKAREVLGGLKQFADTTPFEFPEVQEAAKKLLAFNTPASELKTTLRSLGDIAAGVDAPIGDIAEIYGKARVQGRLFQEDINQLTGRGIPIIQELAKQFKVSDGEVRKLVETGKVGFPNIQQAFADLTKEGGKFSGLMERQSQTLPGLISTALDSVKGFAADIGAEIIEQFNLKEALSRFSGFIAGLREQFAALSPETKKIALAVGAFAIALGPVLFAVGSVLTALPLLTAGFAAVTGPVGLAVAAVVAAAALIIDNWDEIRAYFTSGPGGKTFDALKQSAAEVRQAVGEIAGAFNSLRQSEAGAKGMEALLLNLRLVKEVALQVVAIIADQMLSKIGLVTGAINGLAALVRGDFKGAFVGLIGIVEGLIPPLRTIRRLLTDQQQAPQGTGLSNYFADITSKSLGVIGGLQAATGELNKFAQTADAVAGASLPGLTEDQLKALEKLREELRQNELRYKALGDAYDVVGGKQRVLQSGIESLIEAGFNPLGRTVQGLVRQLLTVPAAVESIETPLTQFLDKIRADLDKRAQEEFSPLGKFKVPDLPVRVQFVTDKDIVTNFNNALKSVTEARLPTLDITPITAPLAQLDADAALYTGAFTDRMAEFNTNITALLENIGPQVSDALATLAGGFGDAVGYIITQGGSLADGLQLVLGSALQALAQLMGAFGKQLVAIGIGKLSLDNLFKGPAGGPAAIAAGLGLIALSGVASALASQTAKGIGSVGSGGGGAVSATPPPRAASPAPTRLRETAPAQAPVTVIHNVEFKLEGSTLKGAIEIATNRRGRVTGRG